MQKDGEKKLMWVNRLDIPSEYIDVKKLILQLQEIETAGGTHIDIFSQVIEKEGNRILGDNLLIDIYEATDEIVKHKHLDVLPSLQKHISRLQAIEEGIYDSLSKEPKEKEKVLSLEEIKKPEPVIIPTHGGAVSGDIDIPESKTKKDGNSKPNPATDL